MFYDIALQAAVAELAERDPDTLHRVNGRRFSPDTTGKNLLGPPVGAGAFIAARTVPFAVDAVSFAASAALLARLPRGLRAAGDHAGERWPAAAVGAGRHARRVVAGFRAVANSATPLALSSVG